MGNMTLGNLAKWGTDVAKNICCETCEHKVKCSSRDVDTWTPAIFCKRCGNIQVTPSVILASEEIPTECPWKKRWLDIVEVCGYCATDDEWKVDADGLKHFRYVFLHKENGEGLYYRIYDNKEGYTSVEPKKEK